mgnify:CR=1 FL=1
MVSCKMANKSNSLRSKYLKIGCFAWAWSQGLWSYIFLYIVQDEKIYLWSANIPTFKLPWGNNNLYFREDFNSTEIVLICFHKSQEWRPASFGLIKKGVKLIKNNHVKVPGIWRRWDSRQICPIFTILENEFHKIESYNFPCPWTTDPWDADICNKENW